MDFSAPLRVLQGLMQKEGGSSSTAKKTVELLSTAATILSAEVLSANGVSFWQASAEANISINALSRSGTFLLVAHKPYMLPETDNDEPWCGYCRSLAGTLGSTDHSQAWSAAAALMSLLAIPGAPVRPVNHPNTTRQLYASLPAMPLVGATMQHITAGFLLWLQVASLLSCASLSSVLGLVQKCCAAARSSNNTEEDAHDLEASGQDAQQCAFVLRKLAVLLSSHGLAKQPDMLLPLMDTLGEAARSSCATGVLLSTLFTSAH